VTWEDIADCIALAVVIVMAGCCFRERQRAIRELERMRAEFDREEDQQADGEGRPWRLRR